MVCSKCGTDNADNVKLCQNCSWILGGGEDAQTSGLAIIAMTLMILSLFTFCITAIPAVICGIVSLVKINKSDGKLKGKAYAIAGIMAPAMILPVFFILIPALNSITSKMCCLENLHTLDLAMRIYANDYDDKLPAGNQWCDLIKYADIEPKSFVCPDRSGPCNYAINKNAANAVSTLPSDMVVLFEVDEPGWNLVGGSELLGMKTHKGKGGLILFGNGHVEFIKSEDFDGLRWNAKDNTNEHR